MMREVVRLVLDTMRVGEVWFCFLQRPRLIAVYEVRVLGGGGGAKDTVQETYSLHFLFSLTF